MITEIWQPRQRLDNSAKIEKSESAEGGEDGVGVFGVDAFVDETALAVVEGGVGYSEIAFGVAVGFVDVRAQFFRYYHMVPRRL